MRKITTIMAALLCLAPVAFAQNAAVRNSGEPSDSRKMELQDMDQQYDLTDNAAGMGLAQPSSGSFTTLSVSQEAGGHHLAQQGISDFGFGFSSLRYDSFSDKLFMKGSFSYDFDNEKQRKWSDVIDPWFSNPFIYGCAVAKDYSKHDCELDFDLYTAPLAGIVSVGVRTSYEVMDISGNRDPRPRTGYLGYSVVPSVLLSFGNHHIGIDGGFTHTKEKLLNLTTIQSYPNLWYYKMSGLDRINGAISAYSGFKRQFIANGFKSGLSYSYDGENVHFLLDGGVAGEMQNSYGDKKQTPGSYNSMTYDALADLLLVTGRNRMHWLVKGSMVDGGADEYLQELTNVKDPQTGATTETWETLYTYENRYMLRKYDAATQLDFYGGCDADGYKWSAGVSLGYEGFRMTCYLPYSSFMVDYLVAELRGSMRILNKNSHKLDVELSASSNQPLRSDLQCAYENIYVDEVLAPDQAYYATRTLGAKAGITYHFPMKLGKAGKANGYVRLDGGYLRAFTPASNYSIACTVGLFTF